jgi:hypothetical protein
MSFDATSKTLSFRSSPDIYILTRAENVNPDLLTNFVIIQFLRIQSDFPEEAHRLYSMFGEVAEKRLVQDLLPDFFKPQLNCCIAVTLRGPFLNHNTRTSLDYCNWNHSSILIENLGHSQLPSENTLGQHFHLQYFDLPSKTLLIKA